MAIPFLVMQCKATYETGEPNHATVGVSLIRDGNQGSTLEFLRSGDDSVWFGLLRLPDGERVVAHMAWPGTAGTEAMLRNLDICDKLFGQMASNAVVRACENQRGSLAFEVRLSDIQLQAHRETIGRYGG